MLTTTNIEANKRMVVLQGSIRRAKLQCNFQKEVEQSEKWSTRKGSGELQSSTQQQSDTTNDDAQLNLIDL